LLRQSSGSGAAEPAAATPRRRGACPPGAASGRGRTGSSRMAAPLLQASRQLSLRASIDAWLAGMNMAGASNQRSHRKKSRKCVEAVAIGYGRNLEC
jgi:hypothetical protein